MIRTFVIAICWLSCVIRAEHYGVDVSFPIHGMLPHKAWQAQRYDRMMQDCYNAYSEQECSRVEMQRIEQNLEQARTQHNYTELGFGIVRTPAPAWNALKSFYNQNKAKQHQERWPRGNTYTNHWSSPTNFISVEERQDGGSAALKETIWNGVKPMIEEWIGQKIYPTSQYGVRLYSEGSILSTHVDRLPLVASCIVNVDQDLDEPWPIEVYSHDGQAYNVTMAPGDMVLYESSTVLHGRPTPLKGRSYANIFIHFKPYNHDALNQIDLELAHAQSKATDVRLGIKYNGKSPLDYNNLDSQNPRRRGLRARALNAEDSVSAPVPAKIGAKASALRGGAVPIQHTMEDIFNNEFDFGYTTPLQIAVAKQQKDEVQALFKEFYAAQDDAKARGERVDYDIWEPNSYGWTPLHMAVRTGNLELVRLLVEEHGADINAKSNWGGTPLFWSKRALSPVHRVTKYLINIDAIDEQTV